MAEESNPLVITVSRINGAFELDMQGELDGTLDEVAIAFATITNACRKAACCYSDAAGEPAWKFWGSIIQASHRKSTVERGTVLIVEGKNV